MSYYANTTSSAAPSTFVGVAPLFAFWTLPFTITQIWMAAWTMTNDSDADRLSDAGEGGQIPVPGVIQDSKDSTLYA